jgi:hypothetical protein
LRGLLRARNKSPPRNDVDEGASRQTGRIFKLSRRIQTEKESHQVRCDALLLIGNWSAYETMMMEIFGKDFTPHRVK